MIPSQMLPVVLLAALAVPVILVNTAPAADTPLTDTQKVAIIQEMYLEYREKFPEVPDISAEKALEMTLEKPPVFIDTRKPAEQAVSMLPNAITHEALEQDPTLIHGKTAIAYCTIGYRSGLLAEKMAKQGIPVINLAGGILAWVHAGGKVLNTKGKTNRLHVYGKTWDYAPQAYETERFGILGQILNAR